MFPGIARTSYSFQNPSEAIFHLPEDFIFETFSCAKRYYLACSGFCQKEVHHIHQEVPSLESRRRPFSGI